EDGGHAAVHGVEAVRLPEEVVRGLGAATDAGELRHLVRLDGKAEEGLDQRGGDRVVAAAGAERADLALVVAPGEAELVLRQARVVELGLREVGHSCIRLPKYGARLRLRFAGLLLDVLRGSLLPLRGRLCFARLLPLLGLLHGFSR